jgi:hypothetical protein
MSCSATEHTRAHRRMRFDTLGVAAASWPSEAVHSARRTPARHAFEPHPRFFHAQDVFMPATELP